MVKRAGRAADAGQRASIERQVCFKIFELAEKRLEHHYIIDKAWFDQWTSFMNE
jgi:hypothetical protein